MSKYYKQVDFAKVVHDYHFGDEQERNAAVETALRALKGFIISTISRYYPTYVKREFADMLQSAYLGVIKSLPDYDPTISTPTTYFAVPIKQAIQLHLNMQENQSSVYYRTVNRKIDKAIGNKKDCDAEEISAVTGLSVRTVKAARATAIGAQKYSLNEDVETKVSAFASPEEALIEQDEKFRCYNFLKAVLTPTEFKVVCETYGIGNCEPLSAHQIAVKFNVSTKKISEILEKAYEKLRTPEFAAVFEYGAPESIGFSQFEDCELEETLSVVV